MLNPTKTNGDNSVMKDGPATGNRRADETVETKPKYGTTLADLQAAVEAEPNDERAIELVADAIYANPLGLMYEIMEAEAAEADADAAAESERKAPSCTSRAYEAWQQAEERASEARRQARHTHTDAALRQVTLAQIHADELLRQAALADPAAFGIPPAAANRILSPYKAELRHLTKEARATAEEICVPLGYSRQIKLSILTRSRRSPPADVSWDHRRKNRFFKSFPKPDRAAAIEWVMDALLKGHTVCLGFGGYNLWHYVRPDPKPPTPPCGSSAKPPRDPSPSSGTDAMKPVTPLAT